MHNYYHEDDTDNIEEKFGNQNQIILFHENPSAYSFFYYSITILQY
jgi:hypothetical protein